MDLQTRKLTLIEFLAGLQDVSVISEIEKVLKKFHKVKTKSGLKPFTAEELIARARRSNEDIKAGRVINQDELEKESENW